MATDLNANFNEQFKNINSKLKRRFMRRPNITETSNEFIDLAFQCEEADQPSFAAQAYIGAAKCEAIAGNHPVEMQHYITAARHYMSAERKLSMLKFYSPDWENLEAGVGSYLLALAKYPKKSPIRTSILMELASELVTLNLKREAAAYFEEALDLIHDPTMKMKCQTNYLNLVIDCDAYEEAYETANLICDNNVKMPKDLLAEVQILRILLTLLVEPTEESKPESLKKLFHDLMNDSEMLPFSTDVRLKLQSIVISSNSNDLPSLLKISEDAKHLLTTVQNYVLDQLNKMKMKTHYSVA